MKKTLNNAALCVFLLLIGCAGRKDMEISQNVLNRPSSVIVTGFDVSSKIGFFKEGGQGLIDVLINETMTNGARESLCGTDTALIVEEYYLKPFENAFTKKSFKVIKPSEKLSKEFIREYEGDLERSACLDFRPLRDKYNAELALVLEPKAMGAIRKYYGFIPMGAPKGYADFTVYLVRLSDNSIIGYYNASVRTDVAGDWDTPPDYAALTKAFKTALATALTNAYLHFFVN